MISLFKRKSEVSVQPKVETLVADKKSKYPSVVDEIHNEFFTAGDKILEEANEVLVKCKLKDVDKGKRLASVGFINVPQAVEAVKVEQTMITSKEMAELVQYYAIHYPNNKFITEDQVNEICKKYGLVSGSIGLYKGFVPEIKLELIEKFRLKPNDEITAFFHVNSSHHDTLPKYFITDKDLTDAGKRYLIDNGSKSNYITGSDGSQINNPVHFTESCYNVFKGITFVQCVRAENKGLEICAPIKDMKINGMDLKGYNLVKHIPDPIVTQKVHGGRLIICAWGDEASDEIVVNQTMN